MNRRHNRITAALLSFLMLISSAAPVYAQENGSYEDPEEITLSEETAQEDPSQETPNETDSTPAAELSKEEAGPVSVSWMIAVTSGDYTARIYGPGKEDITELSAVYEPSVNEWYFPVDLSFAEDGEYDVYLSASVADGMPPVTTAFRIHTVIADHTVSQVFFYRGTVENLFDAGAFSEEIAEADLRFEPDTHEIPAEEPAGEAEPLSDEDLIDEIQRLKEEYEQAEADLKEAETALANANEAYEQAVAAIPDSPEYKVAQNRVAQAEADITAAEAALESAKAEVTAKQAALSDAEALKTEKQTVLEQKQTEAAAAQEAYDAAKTATADAKEAAASARTELETAQSELADAKDSLATEKQNRKDIEAEVQEVTDSISGFDQNIEDARTEYEESADAFHDAKKQVNLGSIGFFKEREATQGADKSIDDLLNEGISNTIGYGFTGAGMTHVGAEGDATSLENMKITMAYLHECNKLRREDTNNSGVDKEPLEVSDVMMLGAQVEANGAAEKHNHIGLISGDGNGQIYATMSSWQDPYYAWYTKEKRVYDEGRSGTTGHYKIIANPDGSELYRFTTTGIGVNTTGDSYGVPQQTWMQNFLKGDSHHAKSWSVDEYETAFLEYYNRVTGSMNAAQTAMDDAKNAYVDSVNSNTGMSSEEKTALIASAEAIFSKEESISSVDEQIAQLTSLRERAAAGLPSFENKLSEDTSEYNQALSNLTDEQRQAFDQYVEKINRILEIEAVMYTVSGEERAAYQQEFDELVAETGTLRSKYNLGHISSLYSYVGADQTAIDNTNSFIADLDTQIEALNVQKADLEDELSALQTQYEVNLRASGATAEQKAEIDRLNDELDDIDSKIEDLTVEITEKEAAVAAAETKVTQNEQIAADAADEAFAKLTALEEANRAVTDAETDYSAAAAAVTAAETALQNAQAAQSAAEQNVQDKNTAYEQAKQDAASTEAALKAEIDNTLGKTVSDCELAVEEKKTARDDALARYLEKADKLVRVTDITVDTETLTAACGETGTLTASVKPDNASYTEVIWTSSDPEVAEITKDGSWTAVSQGTTVFTVRSSEPGCEITKTVQVSVYERFITSIEFPADITVPSGTTPQYPASVTAHYNDGKSGSVPVVWNELTKDQYSIRTGETYTVTGTVEGTDLIPELTVIVKPAEILSIEEFETIRTKVNAAPDLPQTVKVSWSNGEQSEETVYWNDIPAQSLTKPGTVTAKGYIYNAVNTKVTVSVSIEVYEAKIVSLHPLSDLRVPSGTEPEYPARITAYYDDNTMAMVPVEWKKLSKAQYSIREGGTFTVTGTVKGTDQIPVFNVQVYPAYPVNGFKNNEYTFPDDFRLATGKRMIDVLPSELHVVWSNGDTSDERIIWDKDAYDVQTDPSSIIICSGTISAGGNEYAVNAGVSMYTPGDYFSDPGDVAYEDAEQVGFIIPEGLWAAGIPDTLVYSGTKQTFTFRVYSGNRLLVNKKDYTFKYSNNKNAGVHNLEEGADLNWKPAKKEKKPYITITGKGNYTGKIYVPFDIQPVSGLLTSVPSLSVKYSKKIQKPSPAVMYNRTVLKKGTDYTLIYLDGSGEHEVTPKEVGNYVIHIQGRGNYEGSYADVLMEITDPSAAGAAKPASGFNVKVPNVKYETIQNKSIGLTAEELKDLVTVTYGKQKDLLKYGDDYHLELANAGSVGKATLYVTGAGDYTGTKTVTFSITGVPIKQAAELAVVNPDYTGDPLEPAAVNAKSGFTLEKGTDYELIYTNNTNAGKAAVTLKGIGNYTGSIKKTFTIRPVTFDSTFKVSVKAAVYVKGGAKPAVTVKHNGKVLKAGIDYTVKYSGNKKPGEGTVTVTGKGNYKGTISEKFVIAPTSLANARVTAADRVSAAKMYSAVTLTDTDGKKLKAGTDYIKPSNSSYTYVDKTKLTNGEIRLAGDAVQPKDIAPEGTRIRVTVTGKGNYSGSASGEYRILAKGCDLSKAKVQFVKDGKTVKSLSKEYTGKPVTLEKSELVIKVGDIVLGEDDFEIIGYTNNVKKGTATVTIAGRGDYGGSKTVKFKVGAQKMTVFEKLISGLFS